MGLSALIYMQFSKITETENQLVELTQVMEFEKQEERLDKAKVKIIKLKASGQAN